MSTSAVQAGRAIGSIPCVFVSIFHKILASNGIVYLGLAGRPVLCVRHPAHRIVRRPTQHEAGEVIHQYRTHAPQYCQEATAPISHLIRHPSSFMPVQFNNDVPRSIRARLNRGRPLRTRQEGPTTVVMSTCTDIIVSPTGREARGPWAGAFDESPVTPTSAMVFTDFYGVVFADLDGSPVPSFTDGTGRAIDGEEEPSSGDVAEEAGEQSPHGRRQGRPSSAQHGSSPGWTYTRAPYMGGGHRRRTRGLNQPVRDQH